ncbi:aspartic-type endopeptidase [Pyrenophora tritici-repentis]|nr:Asp domain-containing protein [Pyrenophora tritici-repentis]KAF7577741.1 Asp domain containing protein [Pyrenophora tritici-repentis]KAI1524613.1 aspartic-type endopeptidase [Pyrenophora tritici-repentis]KAI1529818.1 aspartic-type endopeptidase [Pyrenophora tritici-repentis]KAI1574752.1 aspartic-type endopeptidase [Pyrenophora tritici-repentis]
MTVGSNKQNISFFASGDNNETYIYGTNGYCTDTYSSGACVTFRGGAYTKSSTDRSIGNRKNSAGFEADWTEDTLSFGTNTSLSSFKFGVPRQDLNQAFTSQSQLGLGSNSSFLQALLSAGDIGTRAYSIFWGLVGGPAEKQTTGSLVLGGLDKSLIADQNINFTAPLFQGGKCGTGMVVTISDILLNWPNGTDMSIFMGSQSAVIQACISPSFAGLMSLPLRYYDNFRSLAGGTPPDGRSEARSLGINYFTMLFDPNNVISINVPNTELVVPDTYIAADGAVQTNTSVVINSLQSENDNDLPVLGRLFMSSAYVMVNQEAGRFSVWQANTGSKTSEIVAVDKQNNFVSEFCADSPDGSSKTVPLPTSSSTSPPQTQESKLSGGAIGGIAAGAVGGIAILAIIGFLLHRRRRSGDSATRIAGEQDMETVDVKLPTYSMAPAGPLELPVERV